MIQMRDSARFSLPRARRHSLVLLPDEWDRMNRRIKRKRTLRASHRATGKAHRTRLEGVRPLTDIPAVDRLCLSG